MRKIPTTVANEITVHVIQGYFDKPQAQGLTVGRKPGKEYNHQRTTRAKDKPNTPPVTVTAKRDPSNGNSNILKNGYFIERLITDFKVQKIVTKYKILEYKDLDTGELFFAQHPYIPNKGIFGKNIIEEFWFTCVLHPEVEPTNNSAERGLRKFVVIKKIIGCKD